MNNKQIAAAVAAILGTAAGSAANAQSSVTTPTAAANPTVSLYIAGSSAASKGVLAALETDLCGGNYLLFQSTGNKNFFAVSCNPASGVAGATNNTTPYTVWYRDEGGSVVGVLPIVTGYSPKQLNLSNFTTATVTASGSASIVTVTLTGVSTGNGIDDSFGPAAALVGEPVQFGISDVEPAVFGNSSKNNYPTPYSTTVWGSAALSSITALSSGTLFDEVYGIFVNDTSLVEGGAAVSTTNPLKLSTSMVANILTKTVTNWSLVTDTAGAAVATSSVPIVIVNREVGSGSRAATDLLITGDACQTQGKPISEQLAVTKTSNPNVDYFATGDVLGAAVQAEGKSRLRSADGTVAGQHLPSGVRGLAARDDERGREPLPDQLYNPGRGLALLHAGGIALVSNASLHGG